MHVSQMRCSLCSRDYAERDLRKSPLGNSNEVLCQSCWQVLSPHPWPDEGRVHGGLMGTVGSAPNGSHPHTSSTFQVMKEIPQHQHQTQQHQQHNSFGSASGLGPQRLQRRSMSIPAFPIHQGNGSIRSVPMVGRPSGWQPASMPETQPVLLSHSSDADPRWGMLGGSSAPPNRVLSAAAPGANPPSFTPFELRNMMDEESLELFESQSHLLDPESRIALQRQRQYLQWQSSVDEPGPMQSVLERQESAGSGCNEPTDFPDDHHKGADGAHSAPSATSVESLSKEMESMRIQLNNAARDREMLLGKIKELEKDLDRHREATRCRLCRRAQRNCVILPCLHFTTCDGCFKQHCSANPRCPECNNAVTGFQTLLMLH